jgi:outer membrane protein OmpA-like peptidoglycan-associated protein
MQLKRLRRIRLSVAGMFLLSGFSAGLISAQNDQSLNPATTCYSTRGMTQISSAEPLGAGRLTITAQGAWYQQQRTFSNAPDSAANIITGIGSMSFGINSYIDIFGAIAGFGTTKYTNSIDDKNGLGTVSGGIQGSLPLPQTSPLRLGMQCVIFAGTSANQINNNNADGYNYFETRTDYDFMGKLLQSFLIGNSRHGLKLHANEGFVFSVENGKGNVFTLGGGIQWLVYSPVMFGLEVNSRTFLDNINVKTDPLWVTPSILIRTPYYFNFYAAGDISLSEDRAVPDNTRALEPYRLLAGISFSFDLLASKRKEAAERQRKEAAEKQELKDKTCRLQHIADSLAEKTKEDSVSMVKQKEAQEFERNRADSLAALKSHQDSIILAETRRHLNEEKLKRSDAEKQLLSTGLLLLDAVYFESGKTEISINSRPYLNIIGKMLLKYPKLQLEVAGHTDNVGSLQTNMRLSQVRAESVRLYLMSVAPELASRLLAKGYGPMQPKAENNTANGRKINRRVEIQVLNRDVLKEYNQ